MTRTASARHSLALFVAPALAIYLVFAVLPLATSIVMSLFDTSGRAGAVFVGLGNYIQLFTQPVVSARFWNALLNNAKYFAIHVVVEVPVGLLLAALLTSDAVRRTEGIYRTLLFIPATLSVVIVGFIWRLILNPLWGLVGFPLLGNQMTALPTISLMSVWQYVGIPMVFLYSALLAVPRDVVEAARIDGAGPWRIFRSVKFPLIVPQFGLIVILTFIWTFNGFDLVFALNGSAPGPNYSTDILGTFFYRTFFGSSGQVADLDLGAAVASVIFTLMLAVTAVYFWLVQRRLKPHAL
ncbi:sugar ABC transporter permease [Mycobacterium sp. KBS0706]|uniref:carbohydrate ABC transporter permease n=1 Tax=Mycobacterium sp. KBS0706 TaxID=2578109 RepID=UPI00110FE3D0|nr:sugar ABC transporter permease [Mycobacterium sp. KBS0706]TSD83436.1 sugar ABC transporter permease [Mycobacterium sp. KBS0706]